MHLPDPVKGLASIRTPPGGDFCIGREGPPKGKDVQKHRSKGVRGYNPWRSRPPRRAGPQLTGDGGSARK